MKYYQKSKYTYKLSQGFTLIELLVSIAIIGILSSILLVNLSGFRERTRDTERKRDLRTIQTALELYRADASSYPASLPACNASIQYNSVVYLKQLPCNPPAKTVKYVYTPAGTPPSTYTLYACLENINDQEKDATKQGSCPIASFTGLSP